MVGKSLRITDLTGPLKNVNPFSSGALKIARLEDLDAKRQLQKAKSKHVYLYTYNSSRQLFCAPCDRTFSTKFGFAKGFAVDGYVGRIRSVEDIISVPSTQHGCTPLLHDGMETIDPHCLSKHAIVCTPKVHARGNIAEEYSVSNASTSFAINMMAGTKLDVIWSPVHFDKFIIWGPDITLYEVARLKDIEKKSTFAQISSTRGATVVASQSASGVRCVDISAIAEQPDPLLALGHSNGRVSLTSLKQTYDPLGLVGRDFVPRYPRLCNSVAWSHVETNMLGVALEKHRSDHCILVWDVTRGMGTSEESLQTDTAPPTQDASRPIAEMGLSETCHNVAWTNSSNRTLLASMNMKFIKIFDLRGQVTIKLLDSEGKLTSAPKVSSHELMSCSESRAVPSAWYCFRSHKLYGIVLGASTSRACD
ncbi:hypothetical protein MSG28_010532 [Choristoneura fumiferana]|uniref:Uncharacterized protein n=1 Tax=Choristoneura fumiferana TaxID=7141 RepID=A0ACC0KL20_CHOFU|nr:hypothetical protein MSG28_010532 [Choristoneura fumiferana]